MVRATARLPTRATTESAGGVLVTGRRAPDATVHRTGETRLDHDFSGLRVGTHGAAARPESRMALRDLGA
jgi:hypothetical protein